MKPSSIISIRIANPDDIEIYTDLMQRTYSVSCINPAIGLTPENFSREVFASESTQGYLREKLEVSEQQKTWLAFDGEKLVGTVTVCSEGEICKMSGFYIDPNYQGQGLGRKLYDLVLEFAAGRDITLECYKHNVNSIETYKKWGFVDDVEKPSFFVHWDEWPEGLQVETICMRLFQSE